MSRFLQMLWYYLKVTTDTILVSVSTPVVRISQVRYQSKANEFLFPAILRHVTIYRIPGVFIDNQSWRVYFWTPDTKRSMRYLHRRLSARFLIPLAWSSFIRYHPAHIFCPGILIFGIVVPWDKRRKKVKIIFQNNANWHFRAI